MPKANGVNGHRHVVRFCRVLLVTVLIVLCFSLALLDVTSHCFPRPRLAARGSRRVLCGKGSPKAWCETEGAKERVHLNIYPLVGSQYRKLSYVLLGGLVWPVRPITGTWSERLCETMNSRSNLHAVGGDPTRRAVLKAWNLPCTSDLH